MSSDDYTAVRQIGKGAFGTAHIVQHKVTGERFVLKRVRLARQSAKERQCSVRELLLLSNLRHRNVLDFKGCWVEGGCNLCLLVELCESGDLFTQIKLRAPGGVYFSEEHLQEMAVQLLSAVAYLHRSNIAHRDLKAANILITADGCLKIADFGLSTVLEEDGGGHLLTKTVVGTPNYMSPDVLQERPYGTPNDIWGLGCVLYEVSALKPAFQAFNMAGLIKRVTSGPPPPVPSCYSENWRGLIRSMLTREAEQRPSAAELLELDWLQPATRRVAARFGAEFPPGAAELLEALAALPPHIMGLFDQFTNQEKDEKRRAEESKARRKAAVAKWDPMARLAAQAAAAAANPHKLPPLRPHQARKAQPVKPARGGVPTNGVPPLPNRHASGSPVNGAAAAAAARPMLRRKTYNGDGDAGGGARAGSGGRAAAAAMTGPGGVARPAAGAGAVGGAGSASGRFSRGPLAPPPLLQVPGGAMGSLRTQGGRPSSAPPDSPIRRPRAVPNGDGEIDGDADGAAAEDGGVGDRSSLSGSDHGGLSGSDFDQLERGHSHYHHHRPEPDPDGEAGEGEGSEGEWGGGCMSSDSGSPGGPEEATFRYLIQARGSGTAGGSSGGDSKPGSASAAARGLTLGTTSAGPNVRHSCPTASSLPCRTSSEGPTHPASTILCQHPPTSSTPSTTHPVLHTTTSVTSLLAAGVGAKPSQPAAHPTPPAPPQPRPPPSAHPRPPSAQARPLSGKPRQSLPEVQPAAGMETVARPGSIAAAAGAGGAAATTAAAVPGRNPKPAG